MVVAMHAYVTIITSLKQQLDIEARNLLSIAYKSVIGVKRASWHTLKDECENTSNTVKIEFLKMVSNEIQLICEELIALIDNYLLNSCNSNQQNSDEYESEIFLLKMKGDHYRYLCELYADHPTIEDKLLFDKYAKNCEECYLKAYNNAKVHLDAHHPTLLGLCLNFSVFYKEIMHDDKKACILAKEAFDGAINQLDTLNDSSYKDSTLVMQLLRDNLTLWTNDDQTLGFGL